MATVLNPPEQTEQRVILRGVSWATYESLLADRVSSSSPHFTYDRGVLEIMSPSTKHERLNRRIATLVEVIAEEWEIELDNLGSNTFKREDLHRGFEPDTCFYIQNVNRIIDKEQIDLKSDPPPDLVIEIDISHSSLDKMPVYAAIGVPEIWRWEGNQMAIYILADGEYLSAERSAALPRVSAAVITGFIEESQHQKRPRWLKGVREWARQHEKNNR
ncbi:MAG: Uma2 family endonuclease [Blastocatellia bacterium]|nr:Uma2 family endonuclease [Blastocatellia bacterium]